jgi:hypothetical protein
VLLHAVFFGQRSGDIPTFVWAGVILVVAVLLNAWAARFYKGSELPPPVDSSFEMLWFPGIFVDILEKVDSTPITGQNAEICDSLHKRRSRH